MTSEEFLIFNVLSWPRKIEFCERYLYSDVGLAKEAIMKATLIPNGSDVQKFISITRFGINSEIISSADELHIQSISNRGIDEIIRTLFFHGEILIKIRTKKSNSKVFKCRRIYKRLSDGNLYPICLN